LPAHLIVLWREGRFDLLTSAEQLDELMRVTRYPKVRERLAPVLAGRFINELRDVAVMVKNLATVTLCLDPDEQLSVGSSDCWCGRFSCDGRQAPPADHQALRENQDHHRPRLPGLATAVP